jgi:hypothetical protein
VLAAWLPAALIVWTHARSALLDKMQNPNYPIMAPFEMTQPFHWLAGYALLLPVLHYAWIRHQQPTKGPNDGLWLAIGYLMAQLVTITLPFSLYPPRWILATAFPAVSLALFAAGRRLYRQVEVRR